MAATEGSRERAESWTLAGLLALTPLLGVVSVNAMVIVVVVLALGFLLSSLARRAWPRIDHGGAVLALLLAWGAISVSWSVAPEVSWGRLGHLAGGLVAAWLALALVIGRLSDERTVGRLADALALSLALAAILVLAHAWTGGRLFEMVGLKPPHPDLMMALSRTNNAAVVLALWLIPGGMLIWRRRGAAAALAVAALGIAAVAVSESLAAKLALVLAALVFAAASAGRMVQIVVAGLAAGFVFLLPLIGLVAQGPFQMGRQLLQQYGVALPQSAVHRVYIYDFVLDKIWTRPWLGWGLGSSRRLPGGDEKIAELGREVLPMHPHNGAFEVWVELGAVGAVLLALIVAVAAAAAIRAAPGTPRAAAMLAALTAYLCVSLLSYSIWSSWWLAAAALTACLMPALVADDRHSV